MPSFDRLRRQTSYTSESFRKSNDTPPPVGDFEFAVEGILRIQRFGGHSRFFWKLLLRQPILLSCINHRAGNGELRFKSIVLGFEFGVFELFWKKIIEFCYFSTPLDLYSSRYFFASSNSFFGVFCVFLTKPFVSTIFFPTKKKYKTLVMFVSCFARTSKIPSSRYSE